jgi:outer membrane protein OmpA-like peptidoglycan-associated protein
VLFGAGSASLTPAAERTLEQLGRALVSPVLAGYRYRIEGHIDGPASHEQNVGLAERRAEAVRDYLVSRFGMALSQFETAGLGASQPLVPTNGVSPEPLNRRVQVVNLGR